MNSYTGIGSRETPYFVREVMVEIGTLLSEEGFTLRSGHAAGADKSFEKGCDIAEGSKEIYLPWRYFEGSDSNFYNVTEEAFELAEKYHGGWFNLSQGAKKLMARNCYQVLGDNLDNPAKFIICWTKDAGGKGGTGQALRIAKDFGIPILDLGLTTDKSDCRHKTADFLIKYL